MSCALSGPPSEPVDLSSELSPVAGVLVLSWSPPWTPDGVQLHYTVTVWLTNTNSTSTTTITMFNTSSTTITISRDNITTSAGSSECDQYVWSVTAINPAGSSLPTNSTTPVSIPSGLLIIFDSIKKNWHYLLPHQLQSVVYSMYHIQVIHC